jgi:hypothetical protein
MRSHSVQRAILVGTAMFVVAVLNGCASPPVQEMSDSRQAVRAAQDAGAATTASVTLTEAQGALSRAETLLNKHYYKAARRSAEEAHAKAVSALEQARSVKKE